MAWAVAAARDRASERSRPSLLQGRKRGPQRGWRSGVLAKWVGGTLGEDGAHHDALRHSHPPIAFNRWMDTSPIGGGVAPRRTCDKRGDTLRTTDKS